MLYLLVLLLFNTFIIGSDYSAFGSDAVYMIKLPGTSYGREYHEGGRKFVATFKNENFLFFQIKNGNVKIASLESIIPENSLFEDLENKVSGLVLDADFKKKDEIKENKEIINHIFDQSEEDGIFFIKGSKEFILIIPKLKEIPSIVYSEKVKLLDESQKGSNKEFIIIEQGQKFSKIEGFNTEKVYTTENTNRILNEFKNKGTLDNIFVVDLKAGSKVADVFLVQVLFHGLQADLLIKWINENIIYSEIKAYAQKQNMTESRAFANYLSIKTNHFVEYCNKNNIGISGEKAPGKAVLEKLQSLKNFLNDNILAIESTKPLDSVVVLNSEYKNLVNFIKKQNKAIKEYGDLPFFVEYSTNLICDVIKDLAKAKSSLLDITESKQKFEKLTKEVFNESGLDIKALGELKVDLEKTQEPSSANNIVIDALDKYKQKKLEPSFSQKTKTFVKNTYGKTKTYVQEHPYISAGAGIGALTLTALSLALGSKYLANRATKVSEVRNQKASRLLHNAIKGF